MIASNIERSSLEAAAAEVGVKIELDALSNTGMRHRVKLYPIVRPDCFKPNGRRWGGEAGDCKYQRLSAGYGNALENRVHAVCWHGFRDFFRACFRHRPDARFYTAMDKWLGSADFEARFRASGSRNIGCAMEPVAAAEACRCGEEGMAV